MRWEAPHQPSAATTPVRCAYVVKRASPKKRGEALSGSVNLGSLVVQKALEYGYASSRAFNDRVFRAF